jgi:hypothetical protein
MKKKRCSVEPAARTSGHRPDTTSSHPEKSPSSKVRKAGCVTPCAPSLANQRVRVRQNSAHGVSRPTNLHRKFHAWRASLPTALERDTLLTPEWIAENVVQEVERFLNSHRPARGQGVSSVFASQTFSQRSEPSRQSRPGKPADVHAPLDCRLAQARALRIL